jgi:hypothetical protein
MTIAKSLIYGTLITGLMSQGSPLYAGWKDLLNEAKTRAAATPTPAEPNPAKIPQPAAALDNATVAESGSLTDLLTRQTGVAPAQAEKGAGALLQLAKSRMQDTMFSKLTESVPELKGLVAAAPLLQQSSSLGGLAGAASSLTGGSTAANALGVVSVFQQQGMSPKMIQQFVPIVVDYVKTKGGAMIGQSLGSALTGF